MANKPSSDAARRDIKILVSLTPREADVVREAAEKSGLRPSTFAHEIVVKAATFALGTAREEP